MFLLKTEVFKNSHIFDLPKNLVLGSFTELKTKFQEILALQPNQLTILLSSRSSRPTRFVVNAQITKKTSSSDNFVDFPVRPAADLHWTFHNDVEVVWRITFLKYALAFFSFERLETVH